MRWLVAGILALVGAVAFADPWNSSQSFQPFNSNYLVVGTGGTPVPTPTPTATATPAGPAAPSDLTATAISDTTIDLSWVDNASDETSQTVQCCAGASCTSFVDCETLLPNVTSTFNFGLEPGTAYCYRVKASNGSGDSAWSNEAGDTTFTPTPTPAPTNTPTPEPTNTPTPEPTSTPTATPTDTPTPTPTATPSGSCGASEVCTSMAGCWCMEEASGDISSSEGNSITLEDYGSPVYQQTAPTGYSYGISIPSGAGYSKGTSSSALNPGTGNFQVFWVGTKGAVGSGDEYVYSTRDPSGWNGIDIWWTSSAYPRIWLYIYTGNQWADYEYCEWNTANTNSIGAGGTTSHAYLITVDRSGNADLSIDGGSSEGSCSMSDISGKSVGSGGVYIGSHSSSGGSSYNGKIWFLRQKNSL